MRKVLLLSMLLLGAAPPSSGSPSFAVTDQVGQANFSSCQSYALAIALAFKRDPAFPITSWTQLRDAELSIRSRIVAARDAHGGDVTHADVKAGFEDYTSGTHHLVQRSLDITALGSLVANRTGISNASALPPTFLLGASVKDVVLSSANAINGYTYKSGHIFTIMGVDGPPTSDRRYLVLNSAASRNGQSSVACRDGFPDDPGPYQASLAWVPSDAITFKTSGSTYTAWTID